MNFSPPAAFALFSDRLMQIYRKMDAAYQIAADHYGFHCAGCEDNCCFSRFYHHTLLEFFYIFKGFEQLSSEKQRAIRQKAEMVCSQSHDAEKKGKPIRLICPLNENGLCLLYEYRPMICRLHGISHQFCRPDGKILQGPGCDAFMKVAENKEPFIFDRTPFYKEIALLEKELRNKAEIYDKVKMTVSEMLVHFL